MEDGKMQINNILAIIKRRKWDIILPAVGTFVVIAIAALIWPPTYRSTSTILIEEQDLPKEYVQSTITGYAEQRLQSINQRVMSHTKLLEVINRFNLYPDLREKWTTEEIVDKMRKKDIKFEMVSADVMDRRTGRSTAVAIAYTVSYDGRKPDVVQQVANMLASMYLEENLKSREQQTAGASKFIEEEARTIQANMAELDKKIADFKKKNIDSLPELSQLNLQTLDRADRDVDQLKDQLRNLKDKEGYLQTQLASMPPDISNPDRDRLKELRAKLVNLRTRYSESYPDVRKTKSEISELEGRISLSARSGALGGQPDNPAYVALSSQLSGVKADIESLKRQIADMQGKRDNYRRRIEAGPRVEEQYKLLQVERNNLQAKYDDLMKKHMEAKIAQGLEKGQMGERFTLIDPARLPEMPVRPNIPLVLFMGMLLAVGAGIGTASIREHYDKSAHTIDDLIHGTNLPVLAAIPHIVTWEDTTREKEIRKRLLISGSVFFVAALVVIHFFVMDLDVIWARVFRKLPF